MGYQAAQSCHALTEFFIHHADVARLWHDNSNYIAVLSVENENELKNVLQKAEIKNIKYSYFCEPDLNNQLTAVVLEPGNISKQLSRNIGLMGFNKEKN